MQIDDGNGQPNHFAIECARLTPRQASPRLRSSLAAILRRQTVPVRRCLPELCAGRNSP